MHLRSIFNPQSIPPANFFLVLLLCLTATACGPSPKVSPGDQSLQQQADAAHARADSLFGLTAALMEQLRTAASSIQTQGRELSNEEREFVEAVRNAEYRIAAWHDQHHGLPGIDHHHDGHDHSGHDHSHSHGNEMHLTPADILALQEALEAEMADILEQCRGVREVSH